jgi:Tfp pilus assembly protein PilP
MNTFADVDPFSRSFTKQSSGDQTTMSASPAAGDNSVHPMLRLSIDQYFIKGIVSSSKGSLAIVSFPGGDDYFLYVGDSIGNNSHTLKTIQVDMVTVSKEDDEDLEIQVFNPVQTISGMDDR